MTAVNDTLNEITFVRGEMRLWSDYTGTPGPARGPVLHALLSDVLRPARRTLVAGPHEAALVDLVASRSETVRVLVRSVEDAAALASDVTAGNVSVLAGSLDGLDDTGFDAVVALDGLDRLLGTDGADLDWSGRLSALLGAAAPDAQVLLGLENEFSLTAVLDRRLPADQHGDEDWVPLHEDPSRPSSPGVFGDALAAAGFPAAQVYAVFNAGAEPLVLAGAAAAADTRPGRLAARLAVGALEADPTPLLAPAGDAAHRAARAGLLGAVAHGWVAVREAGSELYAKTSASSALAGTRDEAGGSWSVATRGEPAEAGGDVLAGPEPRNVPDTETVETVLLRLAVAEDVPGFRALAARLGEWVRRQSGAELAVWDDTVLGDESFVSGPTVWVTSSQADPAVLLAAAWHRFHDRLVRTRGRHPWPPWMVGQDLVSAWVAMSGAGADARTLARGRELADAVAVATGAALGGAAADETATGAEADLRTALHDAEALQQQIVELTGRIGALERLAGFRDQQLRTRENLIRTLREDLQKATAARRGAENRLAKIKRSRT